MPVSQGEKRGESEDRRPKTEDRILAFGCVWAWWARITSGFEQWLVGASNYSNKVTEELRVSAG